MGLRRTEGNESRWGQASLRLRLARIAPRCVRERPGDKAVGRGAAIQDGEAVQDGQTPVAGETGCRTTSSPNVAVIANQAALEFSSSRMMRRSVSSSFGAFPFRYSRRAALMSVW